MVNQAGFAVIKNVEYVAPVKSIQEIEQEKIEEEQLQAEEQKIMEVIDIENYTEEDEM